MIKTNEVTKSITITFDNTSGEYSNLSFQYIDDTEDVNYGKFVDWLNGGYTTPASAGTGVINTEEYDTLFLNRGLTTTLEGYVKEQLLQKLNIHLNEFNYKYENTEDIGIPYLEKPSKDELDLFLKEAITATLGVDEITSFESSVAVGEASKYGKNRLVYSANFKIQTETGEIVWQSIEI
jgi:hypothetical protein